MFSNSQFRIMINTLIILDNFTKDKNQSNSNEKYMNMKSLIETLYKKDDAYLQFLDRNNLNVRKMFANSLFDMNYYNRREEYFLRFIDIQLNNQSKNSTQVLNQVEMREYIEEDYKTNSQNIGIKLMSGGEAFLSFVAPSFEFFSCFVNSDNAILEMSPLLCNIPSQDELLNLNTDELLCYKMISRVMKEATKCINDFESSNMRFPLNNVKGDGKHKYFEDRVKDLHIGFIVNFVECVKLELEARDEDNSKYIDEISRELFKLRDDYISRKQ